MMRWPPRSLGVRLIAGAFLWIALALLISGAALTTLFRHHVEAAMSAGLANDMDRLIALAGVTSDGQLIMPQRLPDPLFDKPYSGRYWQMQPMAGAAMLRSRSLWDSTLDLPPAPAPDGQIHNHHLKGPENQWLLAVERAVLLPELSQPVRVVVATDHRQADHAVGQFRRMLILALGLLGGGLTLAVWLQVRYGLRPLDQLRLALAEVREARRKRLDGDWPEEVMPLVRDLDALLDHNAAVVERARTQAGNLAHALKTPLSILANASGEGGDTLAETVGRQVAMMRRQIDHHLARARAAGAATVPGARADAAGTVRQLARVMAKLHQDRAIAVQVAGAETAGFRGDQQDLTEMLGNLLENACLWARSRVLVTLALENGRLCITIEDDGPGLPPERRADVFGRGVRLDEEVPGSGLGLAIVRDLAALYDGRAELADSPLGGLRVTLELPAA